MRYQALLLLATVQAAYVQYGSICYDKVDCADTAEDTEGTYQDCLPGEDCCKSEYCQCFLGTAWNHTCAPDIWDNIEKECSKPWDVEDCYVTEFTTATAALPTPLCPAGWFEAHDEGCFTFLDEETNLSWIDANLACEKVIGCLSYSRL